MRLFLYRMSLLFTVPYLLYLLPYLFFLTRLFFLSLSGCTVAAVFCSLFCSIVAHCALCDSLYETPLSCSSRGRLNFPLHGPFVRESCTVLRPWHCTVEMQQDLSCVYLSSPSFHINVNLCLGIGTGLHMSAGTQTAGGEIRGVLASQSARSGPVTFLTPGAGSLSHGWCYISNQSANRAALKRAEMSTVLMVGWLTSQHSSNFRSVKAVQLTNFFFELLQKCTTFWNWF